MKKVNKLVVGDTLYNMVDLHNPMFSLFRGLELSKLEQIEYKKIS